MHLSAVWPFTLFGTGAAVSNDRSCWCLVGPYQWPFPGVMWVALVRVRFSPALWLFRWPTNLFLADSLFVAACGARPWPVLEIPLRFVQPSIGCVLPCSWRRKLVHLSVPMRPPCLRLHAHCPALCGCHRQSLHGHACPLSRALGWPLRFMRHNRMFLCACPRHGLLLRVHPAPSGAWTNEGLDALSIRPGVYVRLNPSAGPAPLCAYVVHPWVRNLHCATCSTLDIHGQHHVCTTSQFAVRIALVLLCAMMLSLRCSLPGAVVCVDAAPPGYCAPIRAVVCLALLVLGTRPCNLGHAVNAGFGPPRPAHSWPECSALHNATAPAPSAASGSPIAGASVPAHSPASDAATPHATGVNPTAPATSPLAPAAADQEQDLYDPMVHSATSDMLEDALALPTDCALLVDIDGIVQSNGEDLVHGAIDEAADTLIREVVASVLGCTPLSVGADATTISVT
ncbi:hypothetical protein V6N13_042741 [Hibiscus sabdariffa]